MSNLILEEKDRQKLDKIVQQMISNKETDEDIQFVVNDFKSKYGKKKDDTPKNQNGNSGSGNGGSNGNSNSQSKEDKPKILEREDKSFVIGVKADKQPIQQTPTKDQRPKTGALNIGSQTSKQSPTEKKPIIGTLEAKQPSKTEKVTNDIYKSINTTGNKHQNEDDIRRENSDKILLNLSSKFGNLDDKGNPDVKKNVLTYFDVNLKDGDVKDRLDNEDKELFGVQTRIDAYKRNIDIVKNQLENGSISQEYYNKLNKELSNKMAVESTKQIDLIAKRNSQLENQIKSLKKSLYDLDENTIHNPLLPNVGNVPDNPMMKSLGQIPQFTAGEEQKKAVEQARKDIQKQIELLEARKGVFSDNISQEKTIQQFSSDVHQLQKDDIIPKGSTTKESLEILYSRYHTELAELKKQSMEEGKPLTSTQGQGWWGKSKEFVADVLGNQLLPTNQRLKNTIAGTNVAGYDNNIRQYLIEDETAKKIYELEDKMNTLAPIIALDRYGKAKDGNFFKNLGNVFTEKLIPTKQGKITTETQQAQQIQQILSEAEISEKQDVSGNILDKNRHSVSEMLGTTAAFMVQFTLTPNVFGAFRVLKGLKGLEKYGKLVDILATDTRIGRFLSSAANSKAGKFAKEAIEEGLKYQGKGLVASSSSTLGGEATFMSGVAGVIGQKTLTNLIGVLGYVPEHAFFKSLINLTGKGAGELGEETMQTISQAFEQSESFKDGMDDLKKQFPEWSDVMFFAYSTFLMGAAMGVGSEISAPYKKLKQKVLKKLIDNGQITEEQLREVEDVFNNDVENHREEVDSNIMNMELSAEDIQTLEDNGAKRDEEGNLVVENEKGESTVITINTDGTGRLNIRESSGDVDFDKLNDTGTSTANVQQNSDIEAKKADIEKRRQEDIDRVHHAFGNDEFLKNLPANQIPNLIQANIDEINAKYDAELAELEKQQTNETATTKSNDTGKGQDNGAGVAGTQQESTGDKQGNGTTVSDRQDTKQETEKKKEIKGEQFYKDKFLDRKGIKDVSKLTDEQKQELNKEFAQSEEWKEADAEQRHITSVKIWANGIAQKQILEGKITEEEAIAKIENAGLKVEDTNFYTAKAEIEKSNKKGQDKKAKNADSRFGKNPAQEKKADRDEIEDIFYEALEETASTDTPKTVNKNILTQPTIDNARGFNYVVFDENAVTIEEHIQFQAQADTKPFETKDKTPATKKNLQEKYKDAIVVQSESDLPQAIQDEIKAQKQNGKIKGVYYNGNVYMVADNIKTLGEAEGTYRHERLGHKGVIEHLGAKLDSFATSVVDNATGGKLKKLQELAARYGLPTDFSKLTAKQKSILGQEYIAYVAENRSKYPKAWNDIVTIVRKTLRGLGIKLQVSDTEIQALIGKVVQNVKEKAELSKNGKSQFSLESLEQEMQSIKEQAKKDGTFMKAPNGKPTNLNEKQWLQVRTKAFKDWFGDWINDPENASKVLDENGEPLVVYHGTNVDFNIFEDYSKIDREFKEFFFARKENEHFPRKSNTRIVEVFLNIKNIATAKEYNDIQESTKQDKDYLPGNPWYLTPEYAQKKGFDGVRRGGEYIAFHPNQIKSATDNVGTFSKENNDIRFQVDDRLENSVKKLIALGKTLEETVKIFEERGYFPRINKQDLIDTWTDYEQRQNKNTNSNEKVNEDKAKEETKKETAGDAKTDVKEEPKRERPKEPTTAVATRAYLSTGLSEGTKTALKEAGIGREIENYLANKESVLELIRKVGIEEALLVMEKGEMTKGQETIMHAIAFNELQKAIESEKDETAQKELEEKLSTLILKFSKEKTDEGVGISFLNMIYNDPDFSIGWDLEYRVKKYKEANNGEISEDVLERFKEYEKTIKETEKKIAELEEKAKNDEQEKTELAAMLKLKELTEKKRKRTTGTTTGTNTTRPKTNKQKAKELADRFRNRFKGRGIKLYDAEGNELTISKNTLIDIDELVEIAAKAIELTGDIADGVQKAIDHIKEKEWYQNLTNKDRQAIEQQITDILSEEMINDVDTDEMLVPFDDLKIKKSLLVDLVEKGHDTIESLTDAVYDILKEKYPDITKREVRDKITDYGVVTEMSQKDIDKKIRELKADGKLLSALDDAKKGILPKKSGLQREAPTDKQRNLRQQINELLKKIPGATKAVNRQWKNTAERMRTYYENRIADLEKEIQARERILKEKNIITLDQKTQELKDKYEELKKEHKEIFGKREISDEKRVEQAEKSTIARIKHLRDRINNIKTNGVDLVKPDNTLSEWKKSQKLKNLEADLKAEKEQLKKLREDTGLIEKMKQEMLKKRLKKETEFWEKKLANKDFTKPEKKATTLNDEILNLRLERHKAKEAWDAEYYKLELENRRLREKVRDFMIDGFGILRAIRATGEFSFIGVQGLFQLYSHPKRVARAIKAAGKAFVSESAYKKQLQMIRDNDLYLKMEESKLGITKTNAKLTAREELFMSNFVANLWSYTVGNLAGKITGSQKIEDLLKNDINPFKMFDRVMSAYLNNLRFEAFSEADYLLSKTEINGKPLTYAQNKEHWTKVADSINTLTGRGSIGGLEKNAGLISLLIFSVKNWSAVFKTSIGAPYMIVKNMAPASDGLPFLKRFDTVANRIFVADVAKTYISIATIMALYTLAKNHNDDDDDDVTIGTDLLSAEFGKIVSKEKNGMQKRTDLFGGRMQTFVHYARIITYCMYLYKEKELKGTSYPHSYGQPVQPMTLITNRAINKLAPVPALITDAWLMARKDKEGQIVGRFGKVMNDDYENNVIPIYYEAVKSAINNDKSLLNAYDFMLMSIGNNVSEYETKKNNSSKKKKNTW